MEKVTIDLTCIVCSASAFRRLFEKKGRLFWRCTSCGFECQYPLPSQQQLREYYDDSYRDGLYRDFLEAASMKFMTAKSRFDQIRPHLKQGKLLDVGCADGRFVEFALNQGVDAVGIDISTVATEYATNRGLPVQNTTIEDHYPEDLYQTITAFDVLEHVLNPAAFLSEIWRLLRPGGIGALCIPNVGGIIRKLMGKWWFFYIPEEHFHYFDKATVTTLAGNEGFTDVRCFAALKPITYDYALTQFEEYNPLIYNGLRLLAHFCPRSLRRRPIPLRIGEIMVIIRKPFKRL